MVIEFLITIITTIGWIVIAGMISTGAICLCVKGVNWLWDKEDEDHKKFYSDEPGLPNNCLDHDHPWDSTDDRELSHQRWSTRMGKKNCVHYGYRKWGE